MDDGTQLLNLITSDAKAELAAVLEAWQEATVRLEQTHEALREEVRRLTDELAVKNRELARKNRLADLGQMASHVAHEVRNALVPVTLYLSLLRRRLSEDSGSLDIVGKITAGCTAVDVTVQDLLHFTAEREPHLTEVDVQGLVEDVLASLAPQLDAQQIDAETQIARGLAVVADRDMLRRALLNMTLNSIDVMPDGGVLRVNATDGPQGFELEVSDTGPGLSADALQRAFEPFFTTKSHGTGLGLAIVARIAEVHGGEMGAKNHPLGGATFTISLPHDAACSPAYTRRAA